MHAQSGSAPCATVVAGPPTIEQWGLGWDQVVLNEFRPAWLTPAICNGDFTVTGFHLEPDLNHGDLTENGAIEWSEMVAVLEDRPGNWMCFDEAAERLVKLFGDWVFTLLQQ